MVRFDRTSRYHGQEATYPAGVWMVVVILRIPIDKRLCFWSERQDVKLHRCRGLPHGSLISGSTNGRSIQSKRRPTYGLGLKPPPQQTGNPIPPSGTSSSSWTLGKLIDAEFITYLVIFSSISCPFSVSKFLLYSLWEVGRTSIGRRTVVIFVIQPKKGLLFNNFRPILRAEIEDLFHGWI